MSKELDLTNYLTSHGIQVFRANGNEITAHCFMGCGGGDTKGKGKWYANRETWLYDCKKCGSQGNRKTLLEHFGDEDELKVAGTDPMLKRRILLEAAEMAHEMLLGNQKKLDYLLERGISGDLIVSRKLGYVPKNVGISEMLPVRSDLKGYEALVEAGMVTVDGREFFNDALVIPYFSHGQVVQLRAKFVDGKYLTAAGDQVRIYNEAALHGADDILVVEGEYDSLALDTNIALAPERTFPGLAVIGLPGAGSWPEDLLDRLSGARRVFIGMDPDETGKKFAAKLADEVGAKARIVHLPEGEPKVDWTDWFKPRTPINRHGGHTWQDLRDLLVESDLAGKQMFSIQDIASKWGKRQEDAPGLKLGWPSIDAIIRPGLKPGQVFIPLATTGTGKSVFLANLTHNMRESRGLLVSLELTGPEIFEFMRRIHRFHYPKATREQLYEDYSRLQVTEMNRVGKSGLSDLIHEYQDIQGASPDYVIIDYLQYLSRGFRGGSLHERATDAIMEVKAVGKEENTVMVIPSQVNRGAERGKPIDLDSARDSGAIEETADFVMGLFRPDQLSPRDTQNGETLPQTGDMRAQLLKSRHGGAGRIFSLKFSMMSLAITDALLDRRGTTRVEQENSLVRQGLHYTEFRQQQDESLAQGVLL